MPIPLACGNARTARRGQEEGIPFPFESISERG